MLLQGLMGACGDGYDRLFSFPSRVIPFQTIARGEEARWPLSEPDLLQPFPDRNMTPWLIAGLVAAAVFAFFLVRISLKRQDRDLRADPQPDPGETALASLRKLESHPLKQDADFDVFYVSLSSILRRFIGDLFHEDARMKITDEICVFVLEQGRLDEIVSRRLFMLLEQSDWVKFSTEVPFPEQARCDLAEAMVFVQNAMEGMRGDQERPDNDVGDHD